MAGTVTLLYRVKTEEGWRRLPACFGKNGRVRPGYAETDGGPMLFEGGTYELRYYVDRKVKFEPAGTNGAEALAYLDRFERKLKARREAENSGLVIESDTAPVRVRLADKLDDYVADALKRKATEAAEVARRYGNAFLLACGKTYVDEVKREDIYALHEALRKRGNVERTIANAHGRLRSILKYAGVDVSIMPPKPKYERTLPTIYEPQSLEDLMSRTDPRISLILRLFLKTGMREQELAHLYWSDISKRDHVLRVRGKDEWDFKVKDSEERDIPLPDDLFEDLKTYHEANPTTGLMFPTPKGKPNGHLLRTLKVAANKADLACGKCRGCRRKKKPECREFTLHRFRRNYITTLLRSGVDLATAQSYAGHADLASTVRYLRPASGPEARAKVNAIKWY